MFFRLLHIKSAKPLRNARRINNNNSSLQIIQLLCTFLELHTRFLLNSCRQTIIIIAVDFQTFSEFKDSIHNFRRNNRRYKSHGEFFEIQATGMKKKKKVWALENKHFDSGPQSLRITQMITQLIPTCASFCD